MSQQSIQAFRRTVTVDWPKMAQGDARSLLVSTARAGHAKILADARGSSGFVPSFDYYANSPGNRNLDSVKLPGPIVFRYFYASEILETAIAMLVAASPKGPSGRYRSSHLLFVNGVQVDAIPISFKSTDEIMIANPVPYARKLEVGKTHSGRDFLVTVPNRIYERTARALKARYGNVASIRSSFATLPNSYRLAKDSRARDWLSKRKRWYYRTHIRNDRRAGAAVTAPCIVIKGLG